MNAKLEKTTDYNKFEMHESNRNQHGDKKLADSMRRHGFLPSHPLHVKKNGNGKFKIISGHNRYEEARRQGLPIWYICDSAQIDIFDLEGSSKQRWSAEDFAVSRARAGCEQCGQLLKFQKEHGLAIVAAVSLVSGGTGGAGGGFPAKLRKGTFIVGDMKHANRVVAITDRCREIGIPFATTSAFVAAVSAVLRVPEIDGEVLLSKICRYPKMMSHRSTRDEYLEELEMVYNHASRNRVAVAFRTKEVCMKMKNAFGRKQ